jgi:hypothetical protein
MLHNLDLDYNIRTVTFGITKKLLNIWMPGASFSVLRHNYIHRREGESRLRIIARYIILLFSGNKKFFSWVPKAHSVMAIWVKEVKK